jgi:iron complex outermembrane receptor protein
MNRRTTIVSFLGLFASLPLFGQTDSLSYQLEEVTVRAYESNRSYLEASASLGVITAKNLERFAPTTFTNAVNTVPGVRMEERSPGSYRFSVRGSMLRSPFGIRNVKFYWNGIPFTDASGNTPLNSADFSSVQRMEVIKGPGSSIYGAGTGGVVLLYTPISTAMGSRSVEQRVGVGKYGFLSYNTDVRLGGISVQYGHQQQDGYRQQSSMGRDALTISSVSSLGKKGTLSLLGVYSDLHYQTPGGITLAQYENDPKLARQGTPTVPGSVEQKAGIYSKYMLLGGNYSLPLSASWRQNVSLYLTTNDFANPFVTNYEKRDETGIGGRNSWQNDSYLGNTRITWTSGFEWQYGKSIQRTFENNKGTPSSQQTSEDLNTTNLTVFSQVEAAISSRLSVSGGLSYSTLRYRFQQYFPAPNSIETKSFDGVFMPRGAANYRLGDSWAVFASVSRGFSPPTLQEVRPSAGGFRRELEAEKGNNKEIGVRKIGGRLSGEVTLYAFGLRDAIVRRSNEGGAEYFINAGKTRQNGVEWRLDYDLLRKMGSVDVLKLWHSGTYSAYTYRAFIQGEADLSGNKLPGVSKFSQNAGIDMMLKQGLGLHVIYQYGGKFYLNDANTVESSPYNQFLARASWRKLWGSHLYSELSASVELVKADIYSLGFDLNAFGNRYYNASPKDNFWAGAKVGWRWNK